MAFGTIQADIDALHSLVSNLSGVQTNISDQASALSNLNNLLESALQGSAALPFETAFTGWVQKLTQVSNEISTAYSDLNGLVAALETQINTLTAYA